MKFINRVNFRKGKSVFMKNPQLLVDWGKRELRTCDSIHNLTGQDLLTHLPLDRYGNKADYGANL